MAEGEKKKIIIGLGGAFNPVHTQHVQVMVMAREWLNKNTEYEVVAGVLAVAPDGYVKGKARKLQQRAMKAEHRVQLCSIACTEHGEWLRPYPRPCGSALESCKKTRENLMMEEEKEEIHLGVVVGADRATNKAFKSKWLSSKPYDHLTICIGRKGETKEVKKLWEKDLKENNVPHPKNFILVTKEANDVSSTQVRAVLSDMHDASAKEEKEKLLQKLTDKKMLTPGMSQYIIENELDLYLE